MAKRKRGQRLNFHEVPISPYVMDMGVLRVFSIKVERL
jgi:hypothetical protein